MNDNSKPKVKRKPTQRLSRTALGIVIGVGIGAGLGNIGVGVAIGIVFGGVFEAIAIAIERKRCETRQD